MSNGSKNQPRMYATDSPRLLPKHRQLDSDEVRDVYQSELMALMSSGVYMGIWQLHQAAQAFGRPLGSVYPYPANYNLRCDLNRMIFPVNAAFDNKSPVFVQWTPMNKKSHPSAVNHFVSLMKPLTRVSNFHVDKCMFSQ